MSTLTEIIQRFWEAPENAEWKPKTETIPLNELREWMESSDIEVLGFADSMTHDGRFRIDPPLPLSEYVKFVKRYRERCFRENPDGDWSDSAYSAGWSLVQVFVKLWDDKEVPRSVLVELKNWMAELYRGANPTLRICIVHATLEHLFERKTIKKFFADWRSDDVLAEAYQQAALWDRKTPLSE